MSDPVIVAIRQAFYAGVGRTCLQEAWLQLDCFRDQQKTERLFRGKYQEREGVPLSHVARIVGRDVGEVGRWFRGESPEWANLLIAMTALDAEWNNLGKLPSKKERMIAGWSHALVHVRKRLMGEKESPHPTSQEVDCLEKLFTQADWVAARHFNTHRQPTLERLADKLSLDWRCWIQSIAHGVTRG